MAPPNLQGLNVVHPPQTQNPYLSDQDLLAVPPFSDLSAQLDLWTNLNFQSDEPLISSRDERGKGRGYGEERKGSRRDKDSDAYNGPEEDMQEIGKVAEAHAHENVVTGTVIPSPTLQHTAHGKSTSGFNVPMQPQFDIQTLLASFGVDPFQAPSIPPPNPNNSLAQLLSYHAAAAGLRPSTGALNAATTAQEAAQQKSSASATAATPPAPKRARTTRTASPSEPTSPVDSQAPEDDEKSSDSPMTASEDKRRRNTAASARFRLKKKEREAALEKKAKELEVKVGELEKECEALRRENGWLKGLVVGVTGAGAVQQQNGTKRGRDEDNNGPQVS
ncbi:hypothetical protein EIP91_011869 [Steccherinum ochraceum]|uniref:BZIP domain-containing protein n=1 Tax=Steccherinum ochraceum TaxID=92696 RepID=A0A4R0RHP5_9APHY|nr:hypothetical protein EIP91_011869 [Steccherinum ochraceum]